MKTTKPSAKRQPKLTLQLSSWGSYLDEAAELEDLLRKKPARLRIELSGVGEMPSDTALLIRSILLARSPRTHVTTHARSSLQGGAVLVWLLGDQRLIRDDARFHFRAAGPFENNDSGTPWVEPDTLTDDEFENADYIRVLQLINEFLPVRELAGRSIELPTLRQFGLVDNAKADEVLTAMLARQKRPAVKPAKKPKAKRIRSPDRPQRGNSTGKFANEA